jgi:hypothetical protein
VALETDSGDESNFYKKYDGSVVALETNKQRNPL